MMALIHVFFPPHVSGAVLCFLPGWQDIRAVQEKLEERPHFSSGSQMILPCTIYKDLSFVLQVKRDKISLHR